MTGALIVHQAGPGVTVQDAGRPGYLSFGLSQGGAADRLALAEGAALLGQSAELAALEMATMGGTFEATADIRIALTGAPMAATLGGGRLAWNASHAMSAGARLTLGAVRAGCYGYLHVGGGLDLPQRLGARSAHLAAGIGAMVQAGDRLPLGPDASPDRVGLRIDPAPRFAGGTVRMVASLQTEFFAKAERARFAETLFRRDSRGNRMGVRLVPEAQGFESAAGLSVLSEVIVPGDIQISGDGAPFVLLAECQTTGGYPRIGSVLPADLPLVAQAAPGVGLRFRFLDLDEARAVEAIERHRRDTLGRTLRPLVRRIEDIPDLLSYQLIGGVTAGEDPVEDT